MKKYTHLLLVVLIMAGSCQQDKGEAKEQFRERQQAILEKETEEIEQPEPGSAAIPTEPVPPQQEDPREERPSTVAGDKVIGIKDGDTIELLRNGQAVTVRLYGVDTPEKTQAFGQRARQYTSDLAFGKNVRLIAHNTDRYGRTVGTIILPDGRSLNEELVRNGYAWHYKAYSKDKNLANLEADARRFKRGLWQDANPVAPWDYRKEKRSGGSTDPKTETASAQAPIPTGATKRTVYICNSSGSNVYYYNRDCYSLKRCKAEVIAVSEAVAIREYGRRPDKTCGK
ncbi:endonuclease YncB(thermonuclease family) [Pontibacter ummariensis]|uniref:Endonuclease YncB, thermonuclease family n=1 Tax=Pontibacter ummariensis TaxID=1610492 RepID=A0A239KIG1_9BACT|nr:thermonuclease family protein [Pontibacter ummariensis]PRY05712.1 endonuclease YncB(thermonuclease family) [Pontibacter ummariensis]SNT18146.1 Endonuclease YncB, thermonuclease family [Pontibacter ummariensis]